MRYSIVVLTICLLFAIFALPAFCLPSVTGVQWDAGNFTLSYTLSEDAPVKVRIGKEGQALYGTPVNVEERSRGLNRETWEGKDASGRVDFLKYDDSPHFCITPVEKSTGPDVAFELRQGDEELIIDLPAEAKSRFLEQPAELKIYVDNRLVKAKRIKSLPYRISYDQLMPDTGTHLVSVNVWKRPDFSACAYAHAEVDRGGTGRIAFCSLHGDYWQVWMTDAEGTNPRVLTDSAVDKRYPSFSPDGTEIAYVTNIGELWIMDSGGKNKRYIPLPVGCFNPKWSPDGKKLIFAEYVNIFHSNSKIWIVDLETHKLQKVAYRPFLQYSPAWAPDGRSIIFVDGPELFAQEVRRYILDDGDTFKVSDSTVFVYEAQPSFLGKTDRVLYASNREGNYDIWVTVEDDYLPQNLTRHPAHDIYPVSSLDGNTVFFLSDRSGVQEVWKVDAGGENVQQVTRTANHKRDLAVWVP
ncbi:MAG: hypothetical protein MJA29_06715 [Candidatus Omnitrophica bacterium]|nr:hypothetical protein [Candidatus Omnitrophota bacterium]